MVKHLIAGWMREIGLILKVICITGQRHCVPFRFGKIVHQVFLMNKSFKLKNISFLLHFVLATPQWYPGHIAKTEKELKNQLKLMDVVIEVRDARIPLSTSHPQVLHPSSYFVHSIIH